LDSDGGRPGVSSNSVQGAQGAAGRASLRAHRGGTVNDFVVRDPAVI
jgi:hypothetical protein